MIKKYNKKSIIVFIIMLCLIVIGIGIYSYIQNIKAYAYVKVKINGQEVILTKDTVNDETINLETLNTQYDTIINLEKKNAKVKIDNKVIKEEEYNLGKINISSESKISLYIKYFGDFKYTKYTINTAPSDFPEYEVEGKTNENDEYYVTTFTRNSANTNYYIYKINNVGDITFYKKLLYKAFNFKKNECDGQIRYTYLEANRKKYDGIITCLPATLVVLNEKYEKVNEIKYEDEIFTDNHDYIYFNDDHYIICGYTQEMVQNIPGSEGEDKLVWNCRIKEVKNGEILWEFQTIKNPELYGYYNESGMKDNEYNSYEAINYTHFNSMDIDPEDGNIICSFREIDAILKINRTTGEVMWILGGIGDEFGLTKEQKFYKQHSASVLEDGGILLYDNSGKNENTRILIIKIDEKNKTVENYKSYELGIYIPSMGDVQAVNEEENIYLVTYGMGAKECAFEEMNLETLEPIFIFRNLTTKNFLYCVNKYKK